MSATLPAFRPITGPPATAGLRSWIGLAVLVLPTLLVAIDTTVLSIALPAIGAALGPSATEMLWIVDVYPLVLAGLLVRSAPSATASAAASCCPRGRRRSALASALAAFSPADRQLLAARALLGFAGATLMPSTLCPAARLFADPASAAVAVAIWAAGSAGGVALGPLVGGVAARALLVGLGVPDQRAGASPCCCVAFRWWPESRNPAPVASTGSVSSCRCWP